MEFRVSHLFSFHLFYVLKIKIEEDSTLLMHWVSSVALVSAQFIILFFLLYYGNCSGFPVWLRDIPGIQFRTDNDPFKVYHHHHHLTYIFCPGKWMYCLFFTIPLDCMSYLLQQCGMCVWLRKSHLCRSKFVQSWFSSLLVVEFRLCGFIFHTILRRWRRNIWICLLQMEMQRFVKKIVDLMREEMLFSWQGGPIIMLQVI